jgi:hypothetical protein
MRTKLTVLTVGLAGLLLAAPAQAALDEGGGAAPSPVVFPSTEGFHWADAGIGAGIGALAVAALGAGAVARRHHGHTVARPAAH